MGATRSKRETVVRNSAYSFLSWLLPLFPSLLVTPVLIRAVGQESYGLYVAVLGLTSYFFTLGVGRIASKYISEMNAGEDARGASEYFSATLFAAFIPTALCIAGLLASSSWVIADVLRIEPGLWPTATLSIWIAAGIIVITSLNQGWLFALQGLERFDHYFWLSNTTGLVQSIGLLIIGLVGGGVVSLLVWTAAVAFVTWVSAVVLVRRDWPEVHLTVSIRKRTWWAVWTYAGSVMGYQLFGLLLLLFERGWIIREFGLEALTFYVVPMNLGLMIPAVVFSIVNAGFPMMNANLKDPERVENLYVRASKVTLLITTYATVTVVAAGGIFLRLWLGERFEEQSELLLNIHTISFCVIALSMTVWQVLESFGAAPLTAATTFLTTVLTIPLMVVLSGRYGFAGVGVGRLAGLVPYFAIWIYAERRFLGGSLLRRWAPSLGRLGPTAVVAFLVEYTVLQYATPGWMSLAVACTLGGVAFIGASYLIGLLDELDVELVRKSLRMRRQDA